MRDLIPSEKPTTVPSANLPVQYTGSGVRNRNPLPVSRWQFKSETICCGYEFGFGARRQRNTLAYAFSVHFFLGLVGHQHRFGPVDSRQTIHGLGKFIDIGTIFIQIGKVADINRAEQAVMGTWLRGG